MNPRQKMRQSNQKARKWLKEVFKANVVWIQRHTRWHTLAIIDGENIYSADIFGKYDAIVIKNKIVWFVQIKTNCLPNQTEHLEFAKRFGLNVLLINIRDKKEPKVKYKTIANNDFMVY